MSYLTTKEKALITLREIELEAKMYEKDITWHNTQLELAEYRFKIIAERINQHKKHYQI